MRPEWFKVSGIPYEQMWIDDKYWLPLLLDNKRFNGDLIYEGYDKIVYAKIE